MSELAVVVLCAGKGTRMNSKADGAKVLQPLLGKPMAWYPLTRAFSLGATRVIAVVGHQAETVKGTLGKLFEGKGLRFSTQVTQRGTGDAVAAAREELTGFSGPVLILYGDVPLITTETLERLVRAYREGNGKLALVACTPDDPTGYGRLVRDAKGKVMRIVEHKDASESERQIEEINAGIYVADAAFLLGALSKLTPKNAQGELYLTDIVAQAAEQGEVSVVLADADETAGVNDRVELAERGESLRARINRWHMKNGVSMQHPASTFIDEGVVIGADTVLGPNVSLRGTTEIGSGVVIEQGCVVTDSRIGDGTEVKAYSVFEEATVGIACHIGPFARLRPGTVLDEQVHIGNFVETKKTRIKRGSKANHLAYLGDADIGSNTNVGAGTITCNYDGVNKHKTVLGDGVFIGSDTQLVAPVTVGNGAFVAAGTTVTEDVPAGALTLTRVPQTIKEGWAERRRKVLEGLKKKE